ncbi:MAG: creatininase family protein [bacterium]|nr:creatininase family protein [bacterium]
MNELPGWRLEESTLGDVRDADWRVAVLPMGATEPHNLHLPYATDSYEAWHLADLCCRKASELGGRVVQLPVVPFGTETNLRAFPLAMNLQPSTLFLVLRDLVASLEASGIHKLLILNSHGGNDFKPFLREIYGQTKVHIFLCNWYQMIRDVANSICEHEDDHAGEMETSLIMYFRPDLIRYQETNNPAGTPELAADEGSRRPLRFEALREGWVGLSRPWQLLTTNSGSGNPHSATRDKGEQLAEAIAGRIGPFLAELSQAELDPFFPFEPDA